MAKRKQPAKYSDELVRDICERIADGEGLKQICTDKAMPSRSTVYRWLDDHDEFKQRYIRAREMQADMFVDEIIEIADNATDWQAARLQIDARKWAAARMCPAKYGDRVTQEIHSVGGKPLVPVINLTIKREKPDPAI